MWNKGKMLAACMFAMAWWSVFYPELCFTEETCQMMQQGEEDGQDVPEINEKANTVSGILKAGDDEVVISSRFFEWCEERLFDRKE